MDMPIAGLVVTILIIVLGIIDLVLVLFRGSGTSVSNFLITTGFKSPLLVFTFGFVSGHLFGQMTLAGNTIQEKWLYVGMAGVFGVCLGAILKGALAKEEKNYGSNDK